MKTKIPGRSPSGNSFLTGSRRENTGVGKIPAGSRGNRDSWRDPGKDKDSRWESRRDLWRDFFLTESRRENTRVGKIPAGSRGNRDSWPDPGEGEDSRWESWRDLRRDFCPDGILAGKYPGWQDPGGISAGIGILGGIPPRSRWLFYKGRQKFK